MNQLTFEATVVDGRIQLPVDVVLPENSRVLVTVPEPSQLARGRVASPHLANPDQATAFQMKVS